MGIKKVILDLIRRLLTRNVCQTQLVEATGDNKFLKDMIIHNIIPSIHTKSIKPGSQDINIGLLKLQSTPQ